jgi:hypothetical protein
LNASGGAWVTYTHDGGTPLAIAIDELPEADLFWQTVDADLVTLHNLDDLVNFCICKCDSPGAERTQLLDLIFANTSYYSQQTATGSYDPALRRDSLRLLLNLAHAFAEQTLKRITEDNFRGAVYTGSLSIDHPWILPHELAEIRTLWSIYERNDLLSMAFLAIFSAALQALHTSATCSQSFRSVEQFASHLSAQSEVTHCLQKLSQPVGNVTAQADATFSDLIDTLRKDYPPIENWQHPNHEINLATKLISEPASPDTFQQTLADALRVLALLASRQPLFPAGYGNLVLTASDLDNYPINLISFTKRVERWQDLPLSDVIQDLILWSMNTHLSGALRKLRQTRQSSFHFQPSESGLRIVGNIPPPVATLPRIKQALQILKDLGTLAPVQPSNTGGEPGLDITDLGKSMLDGDHV